MSSPATVARPNFLDVAHDLSDHDMRGVDHLIRDRLSSDVALIKQIAEYIIGSGGKRLRPMLHVLSARAVGFQGEAHLQLAAIIEFIHTATLLHDDVVDESGLRRGRRTANAVWGNAASVLVGDFLYSRSFQLMVELGEIEIMHILADTTNAIAEGEVLQLLHIGNAAVDEAAYLNVIERKTAVLFAAACELGAVLAEAPPAQREAMRRYGFELGFAFQIVDDLLDYLSDSGTLGKNIGDDLAEGKPTLPIIYAIASAPPKDAALLRAAIENRNDDLPMEPVLAAIHHSDALDRTRDKARNHARRACEALAILPASPQREALCGLAEYAVARSH